MHTTAHVDDTLRSILREVFDTDSRGGMRDKLARVHGYADGYMKALIDLGISDQRELLSIVLEERSKLASTCS